MSCPKCAGLLVSSPSPLHLMSDYYVDAYDLQDAHGDAVRCITCGYYADAVMLKNRAKQADERRLVTQAETWAVLHSETTPIAGGLTHASTEKHPICRRENA